MGIGAGQNWRIALFEAFSGCSAHYRLRLTKTEQQRLLKATKWCQLPSLDYGSPGIEHSDEDCVRDSALVAVMLYGGLFIPEVVNLRVDALYEENGVPWISYRSRGEARRYRLVSDVALEAVNAYLLFTGRTCAKSSSRLYLTTRSESKKRKALTPELAFDRLMLLMNAAAILPEARTQFALRNSFAKEFIDSGRTVKELQSIFRIKNDQAMLVYVDHLSDFILYEEEYKEIERQRRKDLLPTDEHPRER